MGWLVGLECGKKTENKKGHGFDPPMAFDFCSSDLRNFSGNGPKGQVQKAPQAQNHDQNNKEIAQEKLFHFITSFCYFFILQFERLVKFFLGL
jgi:hypothetical protein